ncbi:hypothetical protein LguiB_000881 [Lonicera macranthoides]
MLFDFELADLDTYKVSKEMCNISSEEELLLTPDNTGKARADLKAIEWYIAEEEGAADKDVGAERAEP